MTRDHLNHAINWWRDKWLRAAPGSSARHHAYEMLKRRKDELLGLNAPQYLSKRGLDLIESFEGLRLVAYRDAVGVWTIGYGHTGLDVHPKLVITYTEAETLLRADVAAAEAAVRAIRPQIRRHGQFDALVSIAFNVGAHVVQKGHTLGDALAKGDMRAAADAILLYDHAGGKVLPGLTRRRKAERELFLS